MPGAIVTLPTTHSKATIQVMLRAHYLRLGALSRKLRFLIPMNADSIDRFSSRYCPDQIIALQIDGTERGLLELHLTGNGHCEIAISVEDRFQGQGYGGRLYEAGLRLAMDLGIDTIDATFSRENIAVLAMVKRAGGQITDRIDILEARVKVSQAARLT
jgi:GNAT superfamily N-acetyltransferase